MISWSPSNPRGGGCDFISISLHLLNWSVCVLTLGSFLILLALVFNNFLNSLSKKVGMLFQFGSTAPLKERGGEF